MSNAPTKKELDDFVSAAQHGDTHLLAPFIEKYPAHINDQAYLRRTALIAAVMNDHKETVAFLIEKGADIDAKGGSDSRTPLIHAVRFGHEHLIQLLLEEGADIRETDDDGLTAMAHAQDLEMEGMIDLLDDQDKWLKIREDRIRAEDIADFSISIKKPVRAPKPLAARRRGPKP